jgi:5-methylcytosine-specific restriction endonuclease McrA
MNIFRISKPIRKISKHRKKRSGKPGKLGIVRLYGKDLEALREACYMRDSGLCEVCGRWSPLHGDLMIRAHMAHRRGKRNNGDTLGNVRILCPVHHGEEHNPKSVPKKA